MKSATRCAVAASGSPNIANTSQCLAPIANAPSDEPPKNNGGCGFWNGCTSDLRTAHLVELAREVEAALARPGQLHHLEIFGGAAIALFLQREVAVAMLLGIARAGNHVQGDAALGEMVEGRDLARG